MRRRKFCLACVIAASAGLAAPGNASADPLPSAPPVLRDGSHDFDFSLGSWRTEITIIKDPFGHPDLRTHMSGTKTARPVWGGKAWIEEVEADGLAGHWEAANLFLYDPAAHQWSQNYVDSSDGRFDAPGIGEYRNGNLEFTWRAMIDGRATLERGLWSDIERNSHTYTVARSNDGGRTWHTSFVAHVTRIQ